MLSVKNSREMEPENQMVYLKLLLEKYHKMYESLDALRFEIVNGFDSCDDTYVTVDSELESLRATLKDRLSQKAGEQSGDELLFLQEAVEKVEEVQERVCWQRESAMECQQLYDEFLNSLSAIRKEEQRRERKIQKLQKRKNS